jgi:regulatory protein
MPRKYPPDQTLHQLKIWCDRQERCHTQCREKLSSWGYFGAHAEAIISELISLNYLNEQRFATAFASGRFRIKRWGKNKIKQHLSRLRVSDYCINAALADIDEEEYLITLNALIDSYASRLVENNTFIANGKLANYLIRKGWEPDLVWKYIREKRPQT